MRRRRRRIDWLISLKIYFHMIWSSSFKFAWLANLCVLMWSTDRSIDRLLFKKWREDISGLIWTQGEGRSVDGRTRSRSRSIWAKRKKMRVSSNKLFVWFLSSYSFKKNCKWIRFRFIYMWFVNIIAWSIYQWAGGWWWWMGDENGELFVGKLKLVPKWQWLLIDDVDVDDDDDDHMISCVWIHDNWWLISHENRISIVRISNLDMICIQMDVCEAWNWFGLG